MGFRVIVPYKRNGRMRAVSYPASGFPLYTREQAIEVLRRFAERWSERGRLGSQFECYAEDDHERFALAEVDNGTE